MKLLIALLATSLLLGCATRPTPEQLAAADYGSYPSNYKELISQHMSMRLKDPESARYQFLNEPKHAWNGAGGTKYGYAVCVLVNAKNSFGGYTGSQPSYFFIRNGQILDTSHGDGNYKDAWVNGLCRPFV